MAPVRKPGEVESGGYIVCLDCGKQFSYDLKNMSIGKPIKNRNPS